MKEQQLENENFLHHFIGELTSKIMECKESLKIYEGEGRILGNPEIVAAIKKLVLNKVRVQIVLGPVICSSADAIINFVKDGLIELYKRPTRDWFCHFWILDDKIIEIQDWHEPMELICSRAPFKKFSTPSDAFKKCLREFKRYTKSRYLSLDFLVLSDTDIREILEVDGIIHYGNSGKKQLKEMLGIVRFSEAEANAAQKFYMENILS